MALAEHQRGRPKYRLIADSLREQISAGAYPVDSRLPAVHELAATHGTAPNTVRAAIGLLAREGLVESFQGDGTYVREPPGPLTPGYPQLAEDLDGLRNEVHELSGRVDSLEPDGIRAVLERLELNLIDLYGKLGFDYPREDAAENEAPSGAVAHGSRA